MRTELSWTVVRGPVGEVTAVAGEAGLVQVCFGGPDQVLPHYGEAEPAEAGEPALRAGAQLEEYFAAGGARSTCPSTGRTSRVCGCRCCGPCTSRSPSDGR
ncbi:hypothetical protein ACFQ0O_08905 [Saccharopolyspora spinosporotrichia]